MGERFIDRDFGDALFWGVNLGGATIRDVNLSGASISQALLDGATIDGKFDRLLVNGVDVTDYVNARDRWYPVRALVRSTDPDGMRAAWSELDRIWADTIARADRLTDAQRHERVNGEWSFVETMRHLLLAMDKWFTVPILGGTFDPIGLVDKASAALDWPGIDPDATPTYAEVLTARAEHSDRFRAWLDKLDTTDLDRQVDVLDAGSEPVRACVFTVLEEEFEHNRYADRDLAVIESRPGQ